MATYYERRRSSSPELYFNEDSSGTLPLRPPTPPGGRVLSLYEAVFMDDLQLIVSCGRDGRVAQILFIGD
ncbi:MAG: hypothetical protein ABR499_19350 [Gemmatimonadaceae bacterium]